MAKKKENGTKNLPALRGAGLEHLGPDDLIIPRLVLVQPTSQIEGVLPGMFYLNITGEQFESLEVVFLKVTKGRVNFREDATDRKPICGSNDRIKPSSRFDPPMAPACAECSCSRWNGKEPPECPETYNLLGLFTDSQLPFWWSVKSTAMTPTKRFLSAIALRPEKNLFDAKIAMKSQLVAQPGKKYHVPGYTLSWLKDSSLYADLYAKYSHEEIDRTFVAEEETASARDGNFDWQTGEEKKGGAV
jgi:hypothetical protein